MAQRDHALSMAGAKHLLAQGHIDQGTHDRICKDCARKMKAKARAQPRTAEAPSSPIFGSLGAGHEIGVTSGGY
jgi:hypothetical protein